ncbi:43731_t:CDS:1, partial [Gigaspora margarita]
EPQISKEIKIKRKRKLSRINSQTEVRHYSVKKEAQIVQNMGIQESDIEDRRREDSEMPTINKKRKYKDQEDHLDEVQEDPSITTSSIPQQNQNSRL